ncbi:AzlD domain-containing protein [uncultured Sneathiella sp.]|uniref:AzlD family protein n=1 Tax=uncultured Sneathiella sp. TaxID=879315 RepID=UPI0030EDDF99|tara:strand:+ start:6387 stop:6689 length:303 start_codon:yes stop_codon:yes gene_type:complete
MDASLYGYLMIGLMGAVVYFTRVAGSELMSLFEMTPRLEAVLKSMASSVLVAIVISECAKGSFRTIVSVAVAMIVMFLLKRSLIAISAGVICAVLFSNFQ